MTARKREWRYIHELPTSSQSSIASIAYSSVASVAKQSYVMRLAGRTKDTTDLRHANCEGYENVQCAHWDIDAGEANLAGSEDEGLEQPR